MLIIRSNKTTSHDVCTLLPDSWLSFLWIEQSLTVDFLPSIFGIRSSWHSSSVISGSSASDLLLIGAFFLSWGDIESESQHGNKFSDYFLSKLNLIQYFLFCFLINLCIQDMSIDKCDINEMKENFYIPSSWPELYWIIWWLLIE